MCWNNRNNIVINNDRWLNIKLDRYVSLQIVWRCVILNQSGSDMGETGEFLPDPGLKTETSTTDVWLNEDLDNAEGTKIPYDGTLMLLLSKAFLDNLRRYAISINKSWCKK